MAAVNSLHSSIELEPILHLTIAEERIERLQKVVEYTLESIHRQKEAHLNFICTHNSRRSHLAQIWAQVMAYYHEVDGIYCFSAGTEETQVNSQIISTLIDQGFQIELQEQGVNPKYEISFAQNTSPILAFSKSVAQQQIAQPFAAIMTCSDADENCPFIPGTQARIALNYEDPKAFDGTPLAKEKYLERSIQIASEMNWIFEQIKMNI